VYQSGYFHLTGFCIDLHLHETGLSGQFIELLYFRYLEEPGGYKKGPQFRSCDIPRIQEYQLFNRKSVLRIGFSKINRR
jgi:hypothetical protein